MLKLIDITIFFCLSNLNKSVLIKKIIVLIFFINRIVFSMCMQEF